MTGSLFIQSLIALSTAVSAVSARATTSLGSHVRREDPAWPQEVSDFAYGPSWSEFVNKTTRWSTYEAPTFNEVFLPETEEDVSIGLQYLSSNNLTWLVKSGGHGYTPTLQVIQDATLINMEKFNYITINSDMTATVGTGARFQDVQNALAAAGREMTVGSCPCVGATGAMLGGGLGRLQGLHGLTSDSLRKVRMALWNGTIIEASDDVNQDLFWGMRGAGQNFGVVIESTYETYEATNGGMHYNADMYFTKENVEAIMEITNNLTNPELDSALAIGIVWAFNTTSSEVIIVVNLVYAGLMEEGQKFTQLYSPYSTSLEEQMVPWQELPSRSVDGFAELACTTGRRQNMYGLIVRDLDVASFRELTDAFEDLVTANPLTSASSFLIETFPVQGIEALADDYSAFPHRSTFRNMVEFDMSYEDDSVADILDNFAREWRDRLAQPEISGYDRLEVYQNYAHDDEPLSAIYGYDEWRHERLTNLKNAYDPYGFFPGFHPVPYTLEEWS